MCVGSNRYGKEPRMSSVAFNRVAAVLAASVAPLGLAAAAGAEAPADTTISIAPRVVIAAPQPSPIDFPGAPSTRAGKPLPRGYVAIARDVRITNGGGNAFAALRMTCPKGKTWFTGGSRGDVGGSVLNRRVAGKRSVLVLASPAPSVAADATAAGTIYSLCR
jgi:hypothetical protein